MADEPATEPAKEEPETEPEDEIKIITVFGATGMQGGSVIRALCQEGSKFKVRAVTRHPEGERAQEIKDLGCEVVEGDYEECELIRDCLKDAWGCFAVTDYFETMDKSSEVQQGKNIINTCCEQKVKHVVYSGLESAVRISGLVCDHFDGKADVEEYLRNSGVNTYTIIRLPWYYENLYENTPPQKVSDNRYKLPIPIGNSYMYGISVDEIGECIHSIFKDPEKYHKKTIGLAADQFLIHGCCKILTKHLSPLEFVHAQMSCDEYEDQNQSIPGVKELSNMFRFYKQARCDRNVEQSRELNPKLSNLDDWVMQNKEKLLKALEENDKLKAES
ncbi:nmrA-like family domain-containing protein 1 [Argonauta hians]